MRSLSKTGPCSPSILLTLMMLTAVGAGCSQQRQPPSEQVDKQQLAEDSRAMARLYAQWLQSLHAQALNGGANEQMPLDLTDEVQYRFVQNRLKAAGLSAQNAPRLFMRLEELHRRVAPPQRPLEVPGGQPRAADVSGTSTADERWCGHMIPLGGVGSDATLARFQGTGLSSCFGGSDYGYVDLNAYVTDEAQTAFRLIASESDEQYAGKVLETAPISVSVERKAGEQLLADSLAVAFNETTGQEHLTYTSLTATLHPPVGDGDIVIEHPRELLVGTEWDKAIRMCFERGSVHGFLDCDYGSVRVYPDGRWQPFPGSGATGIAAVDVAASLATTADGGTPTWIPDRSAYWEPAVPPFDPARFQVPARGKFLPHVPEQCQVTRVTSKVAAILTDSGGWCSAGTSPGTVVGKGELPFQPPTMPGKYPFNGIMDFGTGNCLDNAQNVRLEIWVYAEGTCPDPWGGPPEPFRCPSTKEVKPVDYKRVCMAEGTRVARADGKEVKVEQVKVGDKLLANGRGLALTVTTVHRGGESKPLVKLRDDHGDEVRVTETHPMVTAKRGVVQAGELKPGEAVLTRFGARKLVAVERVPYDGRVYNFSLGTPEELANLGPEARTLYANGFLVGDSQMQTELEKQKRMDTREVLARLNGAWHEDFRLSQVRHKSARR
uniref:HintN domain-containing protein n=1 Tax=Vitiosangium cumulatum TaxID=1867796 RepID=A0A7D5BPX4_9BACT|nr:HintN domain-containing protein [Vitiosangium cumulatum]